MAPTGNAGDGNGNNSFFSAETNQFLENVYAGYLSPTHLRTLQMLEDNPVHEDVFRVEEFGAFLTNAIRSLNNRSLEIALFNMLREKVMETRELLNQENNQLQEMVMQLERENYNLRSLLGNGTSGSSVPELRTASKM